MQRHVARLVEDNSSKFGGVVLMYCGNAPPHISAARCADHGTTTGHAVAPLVVQVMRPTIAGLIGEFAAT